MIKQLYKLSKSNLERYLSKQSRLKNEILDIDEKLQDINNSINTMTIQKFGAIGDFKLLAIHKNTLKYNYQQHLTTKNSLENQLQQLTKQIKQYQQEKERYKYLLQVETKKQRLKILRDEEKVANEYTQYLFTQKIKGEYLV